MKSRETLIRLKKFQVDEKRRRVAQIEGMIAEFQRMSVDLEREIQTEQDAKALLSEAFEELKKVELLDERDQARERAEENAREQADMDSIGLMRARLGVA
ncbi:MAG: flagellar export protein FliJ [Bradyrhizobium icense]|nr:MAG: flagellar export protein FliJ [Bradyrhizobium icense]